MMITFHLESWDSYFNDPQREALWWEHYGELAQGHQGKMQMCPDVEAYKRLEAQGALMVVCAREAGTLVGYAIAIIRPHMHYRPTLCGFEDALFLTKPARKGRIGLYLIRAANDAMKRRGVKKVFWHSKCFAPIASLFRLLGMEKSDEVWSMWLES